MDAGVALALDGKFLKGYYRRAQARLALHKFDEAKFDVETLLKMSHNDVATTKAAQKLLEEIKLAAGSGGKGKEATPPPAATHSKAFVVDVTPVVRKEGEERKEKEKEEEEERKKKEPPISKVSGESKAPNAMMTPLPKLSLSAPKTAYELESTLQHLRNDPASLAEYVSLLSETSLASMLGNALTEPLLGTFCSAMSHETFAPTKGIALLKAILRVPRSEMVLMFLGDETKRRFASLFQVWKQKQLAEIPPELMQFAE